MSSNIIGPLPNISEAPSDNTEKASGNLDDIEARVVMIHQKDLDNKKQKKNNKKYKFQDKSERSKRWFDIDDGWV